MSLCWKTLLTLICQYILHEDMRFNLESILRRVNLVWLNMLTCFIHHYACSIKEPFLQDFLEVNLWNSDSFLHLISACSYWERMLFRLWSKTLDWTAVVVSESLRGIIIHHFNSLQAENWHIPYNDHIVDDPHSTNNNMQTFLQYFLVVMKRSLHNY